MERNSAAVSRTFPAGSYIIDLNQPQRIFIKAILEQDTPQDKAFVDDNMGRFNRNQMRGKGQSKEDYGFYDITAWSLPLAFGVECLLDRRWREYPPERQLPMNISRRPRRGTVSGRASIRLHHSVRDRFGRCNGDETRCRKAAKVAVATRTLNAGGRNWVAGTFVVRVYTQCRNDPRRRSRNLPAKWASMLRPSTPVFLTKATQASAARRWSRCRRRRSRSSPMKALTRHRMVRSGGHLIKCGISFTPMTVNAIKNGGLKDYNVLILPDGSVSRYISSFGPGGIATLKQFASTGGTVMTIRGASVFAALKDVGLTSAKLVGSDDDDQKAKPGDKKEIEPTPSPTPKKGDKGIPAEPEPNPGIELEIRPAPTALRRAFRRSHRLRQTANQRSRRASRLDNACNRGQDDLSKLRRKPK